MRSCVRRGAAIDLVLDRGRKNRSQLVMTRAGGVRDLQVVVDSHERHPYGFADQQVMTSRAALTAGDCGVVRDDRLVATVERQALPDLVSSLTTGKLRYQHVRPAGVLEGLAECQVRRPQVPIHLCGTRKLAQEWTHRFLATAWVAAAEDAHGHAVSDRGRVGREVVRAYDEAHRPA